MNAIRLKSFDVLRILAICSVVLIHTTSTYAANNEVAFILNQLVRFAVPLFILLSGFLLYYSKEQNPNRGGGLQELMKRLNKVVIPYLIWTLIYTAYNNRHGFNFGLIESLTHNFVFGTAAPQLYFIIIIVQLYCLFQPLYNLIKSKYCNLTLVISFLITLYIQTGIYLFRWYKYIIPNIHNYTLMFPTWIFFFVFGMYFCRNRDRMGKFLLKHKAQIFIVWGLSFILLVSESKLTSTYGSSAKPTVLLYCITTFLFFLTIVDGLTFNPRIITWMSKQSLFIYFSHVLCMYLIKSYTYIVGFRTIWSGVGGMMLFTFSTVLVSILMAFLICPYKFSRYLGCTYIPRVKQGKVYNYILPIEEFRLCVDEKTILI